MSVLVTGASGFLGGAFAEWARARMDIVAFGGGVESSAAASERLGLPVLPCDLSRSEALAELVRLCRERGVTRIVHCAGKSAPWGRLAEFRAANVAGTANVLALAEAIGAARVVHVSSPSVLFRAMDQERLGEGAPMPPPVNAYAATKAEAERLALAAGAVVLRPRGIYGAGDRALLPRLMAAMRRGPLPLLRGGRAATDLTHVGDVVTALAAALKAEGAERRVFHVSGGQALPIRAIVGAVGRKAGIAPRWRKLPVAPLMLAARGMELAAGLTGREPPLTRQAIGLFAYTQTLDLTRAGLVLGWKPAIPFEEGLARTFAEARWS